ncbi:Uncharacterised protein [uncultured Comamonas sp.]|nr:Uncharacterised protein [uncultured Comamonas sp.]
MTSATAPQDVFDCIAAGIPREQWGDALAQSIPAPYDRGELAQQVQAVRQADQQAVAQSRGQACAVHESIKDFLFEASDQAALLRDKSKALFALAHFVEVAGETNAAPMQYLAELIDLVGQALESRTGALVTAIEDALQVQRAIEKKGGAV